MRCRSIRGIPGETVAREAAIDAGKDLLLMGVLFAVVLVSGGIWPWIGSMGKWIFVLGAVGLTVVFLASCLLGLADSVLESVRGGSMEGSGWVILATLTRFVELGVVYWMATLLFKSFPGRPGS
jgi:hypothetical protein